MKLKGNKAILNEHKTAFLCSRKCPAEIVLKSYDWARKRRKNGNCIVSGNHSQIEKDVFDILLKGSQPLILILARGMKVRFQPTIKNAIENNRLLVLSYFPDHIKRITRKTAKQRNKKILEISDNIIVGYKTPGGQLDNLLADKNFDIL